MPSIKSRLRLVRGRSRAALIDKLAFGVVKRQFCPLLHPAHVRTTNPVESTFATVRLRTGRAKGCLSRHTALATAFKLAQSAERHRRRLDGSGRLAQIVQGVCFRNGEPMRAAEEHVAA